MILICAFVVLAVYFQANIAQHLDYPGESEVSANYTKYVGQNVTISGSVVATDVGSFQLRGVYSTYTILSSEAVQRGIVSPLSVRSSLGTNCARWRCTSHHGC